jgi:hypothetical protein
MFHLQIYPYIPYTAAIVIMYIAGIESLVKY